MEILGLILVALVGVGVYVFFKKEDEPPPTLTPLNKPMAAPVKTETVTLKPIDTPVPVTIDTKTDAAPQEAVAVAIAQVAEAKQETVVAEPTPVVEPAPVVEETKPAAKKTTAAKTTAPKPKKKK